MLFESSRPFLTVTSAKTDETLASFIDGKFETDVPKIIKILKATEGVTEVEPKDFTEELKKNNDLPTGEDAFDAKKFNEKEQQLNTETQDNRKVG